MAQTAAAGSRHRSFAMALVAGVASGLAACAADPATDEGGVKAGDASVEAGDVAVAAAVAFEKLDTAPVDGVLSGKELETVTAYDSDRDGRVTPEEFVRGFTTQPPAARWVRQEFKREGFACEMPGEPEPLDSQGAARFQVAVAMREPAVLLVARMRDMPVRAAGKVEPFFDTLVDQLEDSGATVLSREPADLGLHRGRIVAARREDGSLEVVRSVVAGRTVYELHALLPPDYGDAALHAVDRFFKSLELVN